jgi:hypothetical protein
VKKVSGAGHEYPFPTIGGDADSEINMIGVKISEIHAEELEKHHREKM